MKLNVNLKDKSYEVIVERGIIKNITPYVDIEKKFLIVSDDRIPNVYINTIKKQLKKVDVFIFPHGENNKSLKNYQLVIDKLIQGDYSRKDYIIALGGGVVTDLAGFVASTYKRGMNLINIPTTTLAMVDASVGGKVALNFDKLKNVIGSFYHPNCILIDIDTLETLPKRHYINGVIEALKTGMIGDKELYNIFFNGDYRDHIEEIIYRSLQYKIKIVEQDEKEENIRKVLNFGHTFGHAYETYFLMKNYLHGEAVALGIVTISKDKPYLEDIKKIFTKWGIKLNINVEKDKIINIIRNDKKCDDDIVDLIIVDEIGKSKIVPTKIEDLSRYL
ncbi:3-dehydroquinate synthase [Firmicutes bacterium CAG:449]|nr:3-dehydroquinate synthase [Firmicutes bacterium CAG:449]